MFTHWKNKNRLCMSKQGQLSICDGIEWPSEKKAPMLLNVAFLLPQSLKCL